MRGENLKLKRELRKQLLVRILLENRQMLKMRNKKKMNKRRKKKMQKIYMGKIKKEVSKRNPM